ncbi:spore coat protein [Anaerophilus nitritogenes]|uniref:spore coat protein n=1 Tax=Anaerophilus nitritogenes TaxID=2498136 RepID=UPI00101C77C3|nr:spore coat protein [Anaerophilus nitritogenes]
MASFLGNRVKNMTDINDEVIVNNMLAAGKGAADAYLNATMTSPTPELRAMYGSSLNQVVVGHTALMELAVKKGWEKPYNSPSQQLTDAYNKSKTTTPIE